MKTRNIDQALKVVPDTQVLINMVSRRVRQLNAGSRPLVDVDPGNGFGLADIALLEISEGKVIRSAEEEE